MPLLLTILASLPAGKPQRDYLEALFTLLVGLPVRPTHCNLIRFIGRCPHTHGWQTARAYDFAALNLAGLCAVVPYEHDLAWTGNSTFLPKSGRKLPGSGWHWHGGEGRVAWGQQLELLSVLDLEEQCSYPVHARRQPAKGARTRRRARRSPGPPRPVDQLGRHALTSLKPEQLQGPEVRIGQAGPAKRFAPGAYRRNGPCPRPMSASMWPRNS